MRPLLCAFVTSLAWFSCNPGAVLTCAEGTTLQGNSCVVLDAGATCGPGTHEVNGQCVATDGGATCGAGTVLMNGVCTGLFQGNDGGAQCGAGTTLVSGVCIALPQDAGIRCGGGTQLLNGECVIIGVDGGVQCGPGTMQTGGLCVAGSTIPSQWRRVNLKPANPQALHLSGDGRFVVYQPLHWNAGTTVSTEPLRVFDAVSGLDRAVLCPAVCPFPQAFSYDGRWGFSDQLIFDFDNATATAQANLVGPALIDENDIIWGVTPAGAAHSFNTATKQSNIWAIPANGFVRAAVGVQTPDAGAATFYEGHTDAGVAMVWSYTMSTVVSFPPNSQFVTTTPDSRVVLATVTGYQGPSTALNSYTAAGTNPVSFGVAKYESVSPDRRKIIVGEGATRRVRTTDGAGAGVAFPMGMVVQSWVSPDYVLATDVGSSYWKINVNSGSTLSLGFAPSVGVVGGGGRVVLGQCVRSAQFKLSTVGGDIPTLPCTAVSWLDVANTVTPLTVVNGMTTFFPYSTALGDYLRDTSQFDAALTRVAINVIDLNLTTGFSQSSGVYLVPIPW